MAHIYTFLARLGELEVKAMGDTVTTIARKALLKTLTDA